ncbi:hypothetical protein lerEdw1_016759 [Lerista edwardsae]|nr:hypothetical protein lerEdw1_016759 [Lerista edwardsae]
MAASLLIKSGRVAAFKTLQLQAWGHHRLPANVFLSTKSEDSKKRSAKKVFRVQFQINLTIGYIQLQKHEEVSHINKGEAISSTKPERAVKLADEDLRKLLARKTLVTFPQKTFERESVSSSTRISGKKLADEESSSSSSSDSDSSSDSEEEDNALKDTVKTKVSFPRHDPISFENKTMNVIRTEKHFPQEQDKARAPYSFSSAESSVKQKGVNQASDNKLLKPDMAKYATNQRPAEAPFTNINLEIKLAGRQRPNEVATTQGEASLLEETSSKWSTTPSRPQQSIAQNPTWLKQEKNATMEMQATRSQGKDAAVQQDKTLNDRMSVVETMKEEIVPEAGIQTEQQSTPQEAKPTVETPQEDFDASSYKNLQHHEYTPFTFVDYDVELSKFRLPQPSSGRLSPRH